MSTPALDLKQPWGQTSAILDAPVFLEASAGSGKTFTLERLVLIAVLRGTPVDALLGVTFTEKSAQDLRTKIKRTLRQAWLAASRGQAGWTAQLDLDPQAPLEPRESARLLKQALDDFSRSRFLTIHGFCQSVLSSYPLEAGLPFQIRLEGRDWEQKAAQDYIRPLFPSPEKSGKILSPEQWEALGGGMNAAAEALLDMKSKGWFRAKAAASARPLPPEEEAEALLKDFRRLESDLAEGTSGLRRALSALGELDIPPLEAWQSPENAPAINNIKNNLPGRLRALQAFCTLGRTPHYLPLTPQDLDFSQLSPLDSWASGKVFLGDYTGDKPKKNLPSTPEMALARRAGPLAARVLEELRRFRPEVLLEKNIPSLRRLLFFYDHVEAFSAWLDERSAKEGVLTFDAMISLVHKAVCREGDGNPLVKALRSRYKILLIDEFQDTDQLQWDIFRKVFLEGGRILVTVGDPKQGIYGFRGADLQVYLDSRREIVSPVTGGRSFNLPRNYRSGKQLVQSVNLLCGKLFGQNPDQDQGVEFSPALPAADSGLNLEDGRPGVELVLLPGEAARAARRRTILFQDCAARFRELHSTPWKPKGGSEAEALLDWNDMAVLVQTAKEGRQVLKALESSGIPASLFSRNPLFATPEARDLHLFFQVLQDPGKGNRLLALGISPLMDLPLEELLSAGEDGRMVRLLDFFLALREEALKGRYIQAFNAAFCTSRMSRWFPSWKPLESRILSKAGGERIYANIHHLLEILQEGWASSSLSLEEVPRYLQSRSLKDPSEEETNLRLDRDEQAVKILTLHGSKGLEFPVVYLAGGYSSRNPDFPGPSAAGTGSGSSKQVRFLKTGIPKETKPEKDFQEAEKRRLIYVALTRAKARLILALPPQEGAKPTSPADWWAGLKKDDFPEDQGFFHRPAQAPPAGRTEKKTVSGEASDLRLPPGLPLESLSSRVLGISSYTGLTRRAESVPADDIVPAPEVSELTKEKAPLDWMDQLGGTGFGTFYHEVLELADFTLEPDPRELDRTASRTLHPREYDRKDTWLPGFLAHRRGFLDHTWTLDGSSFRFSDLPSSQVWKELDFFMTCGESSGGFLGKHLEVPRGWVLGAIDLIFLHRNKLYVLDWKTTRVEEDRLTPQGLAASMAEDGYLVQLGFYWTALRRMLKAWAPSGGGYFEPGGVVYAYLRHNLLVSFHPSEKDSKGWEAFISGGKS